MAKPKGSPKSGGRTPGTPNKKSQLIADVFADRGIDIGDELAGMYIKTKSRNEKLQILYKILDYCYPKRKSIEHINNEQAICEPKMDLSKLSLEDLLTLQRLNRKMTGGPEEDLQAIDL